MNKRISIVLVGAALCVADAEAVPTTYPATTDWTEVSSAGYSDGTGDLQPANGWTCPTEGFAAVDTGVIVLSDEDARNGKLTYTPAAPSTTYDFETVYVHIDEVVYGTDPTDAGFVARGALRAGADTNWYGWCDGAWRKLTGGAPTGACDVRMEFSNSVARVRYAVKSGNSADYAVLTDESGESWFATTGSAGRISDVDLCGNGKATGMKFTQTGTVTLPYDKDDLVEKGIVSADDTSEVVAKKLNEPAANQIPVWENLVLGLDGKVATSIPVVQPVQSSETDKVKLSLGGVAIDKASGATVKYRVHAYDANHAEFEKPSDFVSAENAVLMPLPDSGVRYYQLEVVTTPAK